MKTNFKKLLATVLAFIMVFAMMPFAQADEPSENDAETVTVKNVEEGATVTAYQFVKADYNKEEGFKGYVYATTVKDEEGEIKFDKGDKFKKEELENTDVIKIANDHEGLESKQFKYNDGDKTYTQELEPGYWVVLVTGTGGTIYNPMLAGVYYTGADNDLAAGTIDASEGWDETRYSGEGEPFLYAKSSSPKLEKSISNPSVQGNEKGSDYELEDTITFKLETTIPSYSELYDDVKFEITDNLDAGLEIIEKPTVKVYKGVDPSEETDPFEKYPSEDPSKDPFSIETEDNNKSFTVKAKNKEDNWYNKPVRTVIITYKAQLTEEAKAALTKEDLEDLKDGITEFNANKNTATLEYSETPNKTNRINDVTYQYTFALTNEIKKTGEDGKALQGAKFGLYSDPDCENQIAEGTSDSNGYVNITGLKADTYYLKEIDTEGIVDPEDTENKYSKNTKVYTVEIDATYEPDLDDNKESGKLTKYTVKIDGNSVSINQLIDGKIQHNVEEPVKIVNTAVPTLPSTGGTGTFVFTLVGVALMVVAVIATKKHRQESAN